MSKRIVNLGFAIACCLSGNALAEDLLETYRLAQQNDPQLAGAEATYQAAREAKPLSRAGVLPSIVLSANGSRNENDASYALAGIPSSKTYYTNYGYSLELRQPIYRKENFVKLEEADVSIAQAEAQFHAAQQDLILRLASAYFDVLSAQDTLHFSRAELAAVSRQLEQTKQRFEVGLTAITDVNDAQARHDLIKAQVLAAEFDVDNKREALRQITSEYPQQPARLGEDTQLPPPEPADIEAWNKAAMEQNLQLLAARYASELAAKNIQLSRSGHYPTLDLLLSHTNTHGGSFIDENTTNAIGLQFNLPLYSGGGTSAAIRQSQDKFTAAQHALTQQRRVTEASTRNAYRAVTASIVRVQALQQAVVSTQSALDATEAGYEVGTRTSVDVLDARRELFRAQRDYTQARYDYIIASLTLKQAAGILSVQDLENINRWLVNADG